jgi:hypothetical protein
VRARASSLVRRPPFPSLVPLADADQLPLPASLEMLLLLLWRHTAHYAAGRHTDPGVRAAPGVARALQTGAALEPGALARRGAPVVAKLEALDLVRAVLLSITCPFLADSPCSCLPFRPTLTRIGQDQEPGWRANAAYVAALTAKLREALGISLEGAGGGAGAY